jgi:hypothetical protein
MGYPIPLPKWKEGPDGATIGAMNPRAILAALLLALPAAAPPPAAAEDEFVTLRNEQETLEFQVPEGFKEIESTNPNFVRHVTYEGEPFGAVVIKAAAYGGQNKIEHFVKFLEKDIGGTAAAEEGKPGRFVIETKTADNHEYVNLLQVECRTKWGYYLKILVKKDRFEESKDVWTRVADSFRTFEDPQDPFTVPAGWKVVKSDLYAVMGPVAEVKDPKAKQAFENRLHRVATWLDVNSPGVKMYREIAGDRRKYVPKIPIHVLPTTDAARAAAGDAWTDGAGVVYLPAHAERVLVVDGSPESTLSEAELVAVAGVQYLETRTGPSWPWFRAAMRIYLDNGAKKGHLPGLHPPEALKKGKEVFAKSPPSFEALQKADEAAFRALGDDARWAAWGYLQCGLHGNDAPIRNVFRKFLKEAVGSKDLNATWAKAVESYKTETKRPLKLRDLDAAAKKFFREAK